VRRLVLVVVAFLFVLTAAARASAEPSRTTVGAYVVQVNAIDLKGGSYTIDFWLWFRFAKRDGPSPIDSFELVGGRINSKTNVIKKVLPDGTEYAAARVNATIQRVWDLRRYPFDRHALEIAIEDSDLDVARNVFVADGASQGIDPDVAVQGWQLSRLDGEVVDHLYPSNYGDTSVSATAEGRYSRYVARVWVSRKSNALFLKSAFPLFVACIVAWCAFFIRPKDASPRVSASVGALFAAAAGTVALNAQLPDLEYATLTDKTVFISLGMIAGSLLATVAALAFHYAGNDAAHRRLDRIGAVVYPILYVVLLVLVLR
jgi:hypothetical protein